MSVLGSLALGAALALFAAACSRALGAIGRSVEGETDEEWTSRQL